MKKRKWIIPVAIVAAGFWACGDDNNTASTECVTEQCLIDKYGEFNADSANAANQQNPGNDSAAANQNPDDPNNPLGQNNPEDPNNPQDPNQPEDPNNPQNPNEPVSSSDTGAQQPGSSDAIIIGEEVPPLPILIFLAPAKKRSFRRHPATTSRNTSVTNAPSQAFQKSAATRSFPIRLPPLTAPR